MAQPNTFRRCRRRANSDLLKPSDIDDGNDSTASSSSLSDSNEHIIHRSNKKLRLETNVDAGSKSLADSFNGEGISQSMVYLSDDSSVSPCSSRPILTFSEVGEERKTSINDPVVTRRTALNSTNDMGQVNKSAIYVSPVHVISPLPSHIDLPSLSSPNSTALSPILQKVSFPCKECVSLNPIPLKVNEIPAGTIEAADNSAIPYSICRGRIVVVFLLLMLTVVAVEVFFLSPDIVDNSIYVTGGGFSGFWFTLGRLQGVFSDHSDPKQLYCYSSGCLALVAALSRYSMEEMWNIAHNVQNQWKQGQISRYEVVATFVDDLLYDPTGSQSTMNRTSGTFTDSIESRSLRLRPVDLASLNVITTVHDEWWRVETSIRSPQTVSELRTMLLQTTWIPYAIGNGLWHNGHMDGAFTTPFHPVTDLTVGLEWDLDLYANILNVNLGREKVEKFWNKGKAFGL